MKLETWLRMAEIPYEACTITGRAKSTSGKAPYVERPDGSILADSTLIIETLSQEYGVDLDEGLTAEQRAISVLLQRTFEEELYFLELHERWAIDENWPSTRAAYFGQLPWALRPLLPIIRRQVVASAHGQGAARLPKGLFEKKAAADLRAVSELLGDREHFHGRLSTVDATAFAFLANLMVPPIKSRLGELARDHKNLVSYHERLRERYFGARVDGQPER